MRPAPEQRLPSLGHTIWLKPHNAAFVYLPKVACTSWKLFLARALQLSLPNPLPLAQVHDRQAVPLPYVAWMPAAEQQEFRAQLEAGTITVLGVVREPRRRVLSAYLDKIWLHANPHSHFSLVVLPELREQLGLQHQERPTFLQFLCWVQAGQSANSRNDHWCPMVDLLGAGLPNCQLWPMERMAEALTVLQQLLGSNEPLPQREELAPRPSSGSDQRLENAFTPVVEALFAQIYAHDLALHHQLMHG